MTAPQALDADGIGTVRARTYGRDDVVVSVADHGGPLAMIRDLKNS